MAGPGCFHGDSLLTLRHPASGAALPLRFANAAPGDHVLVCSALSALLAVQLCCCCHQLDFDGQPSCIAGLFLGALPAGPEGQLCMPGIFHQITQCPG